MTRAEPGMGETAVRIRGLGKVFDGRIRALEGIDLDVAEGEFLAVLGLSGSGKSTLLRCINRLIEPTEGRVWIFGREITAAQPRELRRMRRQIAMIFQQFNLVRRHSALLNVLTGALGWTGTAPSLLLSFPEEERERALASLERVGLGDRAEARADTLSGGQQQRVAIARALMQRPRLVLADEPVASLDPPLRHSVMRHIEALNREEGLTVLCSLHDIDLVKSYATRVVALRAGKLVWEGSPDDLNMNVFHEIYGEEAELASNTSL